MPQCCAVPFCSEKKGGHKFPKDKTISKQWLVAIRRENYTPSKHSLVCKKHFKLEDYTLPKDSITDNPIPKLKPNTVPSRFSWSNETDERKENKRKQEDTALQPQKKTLKSETATLCSNTEKEEEKNQCEEHFSSEVKCEEMNLENSKKDVFVQCSLQKFEDRSTNTAYLSEHESLKNGFNMFQIKNLKEKPDIVQFYTGFDNYNHFMFVFNLFGDEVNNLKYYPSSQPARGKLALTKHDQFFLTLIKLRRNMCNKELSFHFRISINSVNKYFITWINYLYCKLKDLNLGILTQTSDENVMSQINTNSRIVVIDCMGRNIPQNPASQQARCSNKSANRLKVLVGISRSGFVTFVSDAYGGSISDKELFEKCGIIKLLLKGEIIHDDHGDDDVTVNNPQLVKKGSNEIEAHQLEKSKKPSPERINVEHVKDLGKTYKILSNKLSCGLVEIEGKIIFVCFMLAKSHIKIIAK